MKIDSVTLSNFRGYKNETTILFNDLTVFVGKNDAGKSTVLEALDLFFNDGKGVIKYDRADINVDNADNEFVIGVTFGDLPERVIVDATFQTTLTDEFLLNKDGKLEVIKKYNGSKCTSVLLKAFHPTNPQCADLHLKKRNELKTIIRDQGIQCNNTTINSIMRKAIWKSCETDLQQDEVYIDVTAGEDTKKIWVKLSTFLPLYSLFQSDRQNSDGDKEIQDPLKAAVALYFQDAELQ